jgi:hypothetical protein
MSAPLPSLSATGWVDEPFKKADMILGHFFVAQASQSNLYKGEVSSLPALVQEHGKDPDLLATAVESNVSRLFNRYFGGTTPDTQVSVKVSVVDSSDDKNTRYEIRLDASVTIDGTFYSLGRIVDVENSSITKIIEINNG